MTSILKVGPGDESKDAEIEFELAYLAGLTTAQRFEMLLRRSREMAEELVRRGHRDPARIVKRASVTT